MLLLYIFILVMIFSAVPLLISMTKKASEGATMKRAIEQRGGKFIPTHAIWYMGEVNSERCDFHVVFDNRVISVKVISLLSSNVLLNFIDKENYGIKTLSAKLTENKDSVIYENKKKKPYDFKHGLKPEYSKLPHASVILLNEPRPLRISRATDDGIIDLHTGDQTGEGELYTTHSFIELFK